MQLKEIKLLFEAGVLTRCLIAQASLSEEKYIVSFARFGSDSLEILESQRGGAREFSSYDSAVRTIKHIGFNSVVVEGLQQ